ncbi:MAG: energy-coupled thiamine transporter ThiT [Peptostreptococcaceae bacterium]|jgi:thiamine transporter|nr:energy-coupled thiamine transporter ThiT [Peptostreptococcaceae bacterium]
MPELNANFFESFKEFKLITIVILAVLVLIAILGSLKKEENKFNTRMMVYGGLCVSLAFVLSYVRIFHWPQGGSITPASMLPLVIFASIFGVVPGIIAGIAYGFLQLIQDPYIVHWAQVLLDYPLAFGALGIAGLFKKNLAMGAFFGGVSRMFFHFLSGVIFFGQYAPEGMSPYLYSLMVNGILIGSETLICVVVATIPQFKTMRKKVSA